MSNGTTSPSPGFGRHPGLLLVMMPVLAMLSAIVTVRHDPELPFRTGIDYSPYGYTISLGLFIVPCATLALWFHRKKVEMPFQWRAFWMTTALVAPTWCLLDIFLGNAFFRFPNAGATLGIFAPGYEWGTGWPRTIPVEEFAFYILGCFAILLSYIWAAESWLSAYTLSAGEYLDRVGRVPRLVRVRPIPVAVGVVIFLIALVWKKFGWHEHTAGFPSYFLFELTMVIAPAAVLYDAVKPIINVPAFVFKTLTLVLISLLWEVTLALPYGWWGYRHENMMGILVRPWFNLPVEAVILWPCAAWLNVVLYETIRLYVRSGRPLMDVLFGRTPPAATTV